MTEKEQYKQLQKQNHARLLQDIGNALLKGKQPQLMKEMLARLEISQGSRELSSSQLNQIPTLELAISSTDNTVTIVYQPHKKRTVQPHQLFCQFHPDLSLYPFSSKAVLIQASLQTLMSRLFKAIAIIFLTFHVELLARL